MLRYYDKNMQLIYKICAAAEWERAVASGVFRGFAVDHKAGFIHFSAAHQVRETARKHFAGRDELVLVALAEQGLPSLRWEPSRGGELFPHLYAEVAINAARSVQPLPLKHGIHVFPEGVPE